MLSLGKNNKAFIITIDTEGDNLWASTDVRQKVATENAKFLFRFQELCEKYGLIPTYLTNYEMACDDAMIELGREGIKKGTLEIGAHEHAWNQPPYYHLCKCPGKRGKPFLSEYPKRVIKRKLQYLTCQLQDTFQCPIYSHRGGRWCLDDNIATELAGLGYIADCTCTPGIDWSTTPGWSLFSKGTDWSKFSNKPFFLQAKSDQGDRNLSVLEIPMTVIDMKENGNYSWLRPNLKNKYEMMALVDSIIRRNGEYAEFMLHSSELMPGGSPTFDNKGKIEKLYQDMEELFDYSRQKGFVGMGMAEYAQHYIGRQGS